MNRKISFLSLALVVLLLVGCSSTSDQAGITNVKDLQSGDHLLFLFTSPT